MNEDITEFGDAENRVALAKRLYGEGDLSGAIACLRRVSLWYAAQDRSSYLTSANRRLRRARAEACHLCADYLLEAEAFPESANLYQEAVDTYGSLSDRDSLDRAKACAQLAVNAINALRVRPQDRLQLLISWHERQIAQLALLNDTERQRAQIYAQLGRIFQRRERFGESCQVYEAALALYQGVSLHACEGLGMAECHHQAGNLYFHRLNNPRNAAKNYRAALRLYDAYALCEDLDVDARELCALALKELEARHRECLVEENSVADGND